METLISMRWPDQEQTHEPIDDQLAIEREMARRLKSRGLQRFYTLALCLATALLAAGIFVYREAQTPVEIALPPPAAPAARPVTPPAAVVDKDQTKLTATSSSDNDAAPPPRVTTTPGSTRQIELGQRPQIAPLEPAGNNEEPITMTTAPVPLPRLSP